MALDGMYGAVHHQGDVYDSTVACIPFLFELVAMDGLPGRGDIVDLLRSVHGDGRNVEGGDFWSDDEEEHAAWVATLARAESDTRARSGMLLELLDDADAGLRRALPGALVQLHDDPAVVLAALRRRLVVEPDAGVARALATALGELGVRDATCARQTGDALAALLAGDGGPTATDPGRRLAVLVQLVRLAPERLPVWTVEIATAAMREGAGRAGRRPAVRGPVAEGPGARPADTDDDLPSAPAQGVAPRCGAGSLGDRVAGGAAPCPGRPGPGAVRAAGGPVAQPGLGAAACGDRRQWSAAHGVAGALRGVGAAAGRADEGSRPPHRAVGGLGAGVAVCDRRPGGRGAGPTGRGRAGVPRPGAVGRDVAGAWARMGPAATAAVPLLREEVAAVRRHNNSGGTGRIRYRCADDERLLRHARAALTSCEEEWSPSTASDG